MSHFAVLVIGDDIEGQLAKFDENLDTPRYVQYTKEQLIAKGRQDIKDYQKGLYAQYLANPEKYASECKNEGHMEYISNEFPKKLNWTDEEVYQEEIEWYGPKEIGKDGEVYSTRNPHSKWDWYEVGGRYAGRLILKEGVEKESEPNFSWGWDANTREEVLREPRVDSARVGDLDWSKLHRTQKNYDEAIRFWEMKVEGAKPVTDEEKKQLEWDWYRDGYYQERYGNKETYAKCISSFTAWAVVKDGEWFEKGKMGMFASSDETHDEAIDWEMNMFDRFIKDLSPDTVITFVDCHI
jgi:hypothetical protein